MLQRQAVFFIKFCTGLLFLAMPAFAQMSVPRYEILEITLTGSDLQNPYLDCRLWAEFVGPDGKSFSLEGFWDGGITWKIRVALNKVGAWNYFTHSNDPLLDKKTGLLECTTGAGKGFIEQVDRHFYYQDGTPFFRMGDTCWRMFRSKNAPYESHFKPYINARSDQGFNFIMGAIHTSGDPSINEGGSLWYNDTDLDRLQPGYFQWVDKRINYMRKAGIVPGVVLVWSDTFDDFYQPPYSRDTFSRFRRYVIARYAAYNVFWILSGEYSEAMNPGEYDYHAEIIRYGNNDPGRGLEDSGDPYHHPLSIHPGGQESNTQNIDIFHDWLMYSMQQMYGSPADLHDKILQDYSYNLPICNDEFGYEGPTDPKDPYYFNNNQSAVETRRDAWTILCSGGYFTWGNIYTYTGKSFVLRADKLYSAGAECMRLLADFINNGIPFNKMTAKQSCVVKGEAYCLAKEGEVYMIYFPTAGSASINLDAGGQLFQAFWYNPAAGDTVLMGGMSGDRTYALASPFGHDGVLHVHNTREGTVSTELLHFTAEPENGRVRLNWATGGKLDIAGFSIDRSINPDGPYATVLSYIDCRQTIDGSPAEPRLNYAWYDSTADSNASCCYRLFAIDLNGRTKMLSTIMVNFKQNVIDRELPTPVSLDLYSNYPNPFNQSTRISFVLPEIMFVDVSVYNATGRIIRTLCRKELTKGQHQLTWDGRDALGFEAVSGVYFCRLSTFDSHINIKMTLLR